MAPVYFFNYYCLHLLICCLILLFCVFILLIQFVYLLSFILHPFYLFVHLINLLNQLHTFSYLFYLLTFNLTTQFIIIHVYCLFNLVSFSTFAVIYPMEHLTGFQSSPAECFPKRVTCEAPVSCFGYIGWKPGRKFRSRIRIDGSESVLGIQLHVPKQDQSVDSHSQSSLDLAHFSIVYFITYSYCFRTYSLCLSGLWWRFPTSLTRAFQILFKYSAY